MTIMKTVNEYNETRNILIDIHNNYKNYNLQDVLEKIDDNYNNIQKIINIDIMLFEEFNEIYLIANSELVYGIDEYSHIYTLFRLLNIIKTIIDYK